MDLLDVVVVGLLVLAAWAGWQLGFARRVMTWLGLLGGLALASWLLPHLIRPESTPPGPSRFALSAGVLLIGAALGQILGGFVGGRLGWMVERARLTRLDAVLGLVAGVLGASLALWIVLPAMADVPGWPSQQARNSATARFLDSALGTPPGVLGNLSQTLGLGQWPKVFDQIQPTPDVAAPPAVSPVPAAVTDHAIRSTVKVVTAACGRIQSGTGFVVSPGVVVTNAHVVAGGRDTRIETTDRQRTSATVVAFDPRADLAVLRAPGLTRPPLRLADARAGDQGVVLGFAGGGPLTTNPYSVSERLRAEGRDIYDQATVVRTVLVLGASLRPGDSGGPMVDPKGQVAGIAFAIAPDRPHVSYAITTSQIKDVLARISPREVSTGSCAA
jgi:S1-C subfamily serine protease